MPPPDAAQLLSHQPTSTTSCGCDLVVLGHHHETLYYCPHSAVSSLRFY